MRIFITGGAGYIGSHTVVALLESGHEVFVFDNFEFGNEVALKRVEEITGKKVEYEHGDIRNPDNLMKSLEKGFDAVIHFAAYKNVSESVQQPDKFYDNNIRGTYNILETMRKQGIDNIIFSSSATVYGQPEHVPVTEDAHLQPISPYGHTKLACEWMVQDYSVLGINSVSLRYFNPVGAHPSGRIGENPEVLLNVVPRIFGKLQGKFEFKMFGNKFDTPDGTQIRDYVHVMDLAEGHVKALEYLQNTPGKHIFNLGTGEGTSLLQLIHESETVTGKKLEYEVTDPNPADPVILYADVSKAQKKLQWQAKRNYKEMIKDAWNWYKNNPEGYKSI